jgi:hypothetical protein
MGHCERGCRTGTLGRSRGYRRTGTTAKGREFESLSDRVEIAKMCKGSTVGRVVTDPICLLVNDFTPLERDVQRMVYA